MTRRGKALAVGTLSRGVIRLAYEHVADGQAYEHEFSPGVCLDVLADGSIRVYRPDGLPVWEDL